MYTFDLERQRFMRESNYRKIKISRKTWKIIIGAVAAGLLAGIITFFTFYSVKEVEVMGSSHYSEKEVKKMVLRGPAASNSVLAPLLYTKDDVTDVPFIEGFTVTQINRSTICISVKEKKPVGCIPYLDSYIYFDRNGVFIEGSKERDETVPYFDGIQVNQVIMNEKLPIKGKTVLNTAVALATIFQKNEMIPDHIQFSESYEISLVYGDITVQLGKDEDLEEKMSRAIAILAQLTGKKGILHMESVTGSGNTFEIDQSEEEAKQAAIAEAQAALEAWTGGYDEEGDYTGAGEYDAEGNYVGPAPEVPAPEVSAPEVPAADGSEDNSTESSEEYSEDYSSYDDSGYYDEYGVWQEGYADEY